MFFFERMIYNDTTRAVATNIFFKYMCVCVWGSFGQMANEVSLFFGRASWITIGNRERFEGQWTSFKTIKFATTPVVRRPTVVSQTSHNDKGTFSRSVKTHDQI